MARKYNRMFMILSFSSQLISIATTVTVSASYTNPWILIPINIANIIIVSLIQMLEPQKKNKVHVILKKKWSKIKLFTSFINEKTCRTVFDAISVLKSEINASF